MHDPLYELTSQRQKGQFAIGSVGVEEPVIEHVERPDAN